MILWRVKATWANLGTLGEIDMVVKADDAMKALSIAWAPGDARDLRNVSIEWLTPDDCILEEVKEGENVTPHGTEPTA